jgi:hypothetical protein
MRRRRKTLPFRAARLVDVNVGVHNTWHDDGVLSIVYRYAARCIVERADPRDEATSDVNCCRAFTFWRYDSPSANNQVGRFCEVDR